MRSKLFVPASRPELFAKARAGAADALSFDLEDAVSPERKPEARDNLRALLSPDSVATKTQTWIVRVNALDTVHFAADIAAVVRPGLDLINLPKAESVDDVLRVIGALEDAEARHDVPSPIGLLLNIETPRSLRLAADLAAAHPRVKGLQLGLGDLFEPLGIRRGVTVAIQQAMFAVRLAAGEAGIYAYDGAFANIKDTDGYREEAQLAHGLGFLGKTCIHPSQIAIANDVFRPSDEDIAHAVRVVEAAHTAEKNGVGAYVVDGRMIDPPFFNRALALVREAERLGLIDAK